MTNSLENYLAARNGNTGTLWRIANGPFIFDFHNPWDVIALHATLRIAEKYHAQFCDTGPSSELREVVRRCESIEVWHAVVHSK